MALNKVEIVWSRQTPDGPPSATVSVETTEGFRSSEAIEPEACGLFDDFWGENSVIGNVVFHALEAAEIGSAENAI